MNGIFITAELPGALASRIHEVQEKHDPRLAREFPPHVTIVGSSGAGPISPDTPREVLERVVRGVTDRLSPVAARFEPAMRFIGREIVVLPLSPRGAIRELHDALKMSGLSFETARWPFTPHCTLNYYATLTPDRLASLLAVREPEPWEIAVLRVYHTRTDQRAELLFDAPLNGSRRPGRDETPPRTLSR
jgi:2'-5' RNA ligase